MSSYDVFNGDADGICALLQLRLAEPRESTLITGVKRDIDLVEQVPTDLAHEVTVLDVSLDRNRPAIDRLLAAGSRVFYVDHHYAGEQQPDHAGFTSLIDTHPTTCTSLLVDRHLEGRFHHWAIAAAFGDNLNAVAVQLADRAGLDQEQVKTLKELGICINYNGYGATTDDLYFHPADLYRELLPFSDPLDIERAQPEAWQKLHHGYEEDMALGLSAKSLCQTDTALVVVLPDKPWARRVNGVLGNELANRNPDAACAVLTETVQGHYQVSIRAPLNNRTGADEVARQFPTGGGRKAAAGINELPEEMLGRFVEVMKRYWA